MHTGNTVVSALHFPTILFDWGDTVMKDDPTSTVPMVEWTDVEAVPEINSVLEYLQSSGRQIILATSASISDESQIRAALGRVDVDGYFSRIYCFQNTGLSKGEAFYQHILNDLGLSNSSKVLMVGDTFEKDVLAANKVGMFAVWFNPRSDESRGAELHVTVHSMEELRSFFMALDC